ncbi:MAG: LamG domain-containing protein, partial [Deltaproteobacteria bacterium]|nr:LamG domain-containing protein [Deltaproteobacteria bacterium]
TSQRIFGKWTAAGDQRSYSLLTGAADRFTFQITNLGTFADIDQVADTVDYDTGEWYFIVGRFDPSAAIYIDVNGRNTSTVAGIPASIFNSTSGLEIGSRDGGTAELYTGYVSCAFLCATYLSDAIVSSLFQQTRAAFGV